MGSVWQLVPRTRNCLEVDAEHIALSLYHEAIVPSGAVFEFAKGGLCEVEDIVHPASLKIPDIEHARRRGLAKSCRHEKETILDKESLIDGLVIFAVGVLDKIVLKQVLVGQRDDTV